MEKYRKQVKEAAALRNGEPLYNSSLDHATVLTEALFEHAQRDVCILSGRMNALVYGASAVIEKARLFLSDRDRTVRVIVEDPSAIDVRDHPFFTAFLGHHDVEIRVLDSGLSELLPYHFMVMDSDSYRFEHDKTLPHAIAAFGDRTVGANLSHVFSELWGQSNPWSTH
jgi:hypothetical protein